MARVICEEVRPDYLTLLNEPDTQSKNTGLDLHVEPYTEVIQFVLNGLDRRETRVGAGAGTWERFEYFESLAKQTAVDYIDMHIYPVQRDFVIDKCLRIAALARTYNKKLGHRRGLAVQGGGDGARTNPSCCWPSEGTSSISGNPGIFNS